MSSSDTNPGVYPGNPSLPREVREKILSTFRHTLNLYKEGKLDDCLIGCDFILKMDARFIPARRLLEKAKNPSAEVDVAELEALVAGTLTRQERVVAAEPDRLLVRAVESYNARDFDAAAGAAEQVLQVLPGNQDAVEILEKARRKKAAQPLVEAAKLKAIAALGGNRLDDARREVAKIKALDPDHPSVGLLESKLGASAPAASAPAPPTVPQLGDSFSAFGEDQSEPHIAFDDKATMAIRLDDLPPSYPVQPPPDMMSDTSPLKQKGRPPVAPPPSLTPLPRPPKPAPEPAAPAPAAMGSLDGLSLDSLSLDMPASPAPRRAILRAGTGSCSAEGIASGHVGSSRGDGTRFPRRVHGARVPRGAHRAAAATHSHHGAFLRPRLLRRAGGSRGRGRLRAQADLRH